MMRNKRYARRQGFRSKNPETIRRRRAAGRQVLAKCASKNKSKFVFG